LNKVWLWIKEYSHVLRVIGGLFFALTLITGFIWIAGYQIEPVVFTLSIFSSLFLASPSIAMYFLPDRKPVRDMVFEEILSFIPTTDSENDWYGVTRNWSSERFLKEDPRLRFRAKFTEDGVQAEDFQDEWANCHPNPHARGYWYDLYYDGAFLDRIILVAVDGGNSSIPCPDFKTGKIRKFDHHVAKIFDTLQNVDEYIRRSGLEVEDT
jgi:hypothetical protein